MTLTIKLEAAVAVPLSSVVVTLTVWVPPVVYGRLIVPVAVKVFSPLGVKTTLAPSTFAVSVRMPPKLLVAVNVNGTTVAAVPIR